MARQRQTTTTGHVGQPSVLALVTSRMGRRLSDLVYFRNRVETVPDLRELMWEVANVDWPMVLVEPSTLADSEILRVARAVAASRSRLCLLTDLDATTSRQILGVVKAGVADLLVVEAGELLHCPADFWHPARMSSATACVLHALAHHISLLPREFVPPVLGLFSPSIPLPIRAARLSQQIGCSLRSLERHLNAVGLVGPRKLINVARLARSLGPVVNSLNSAELIAESCGYADVRTYTAHCSKILAQTFRGLRKEGDVHTFTRRLAAAALAPVVAPR